MKKTILIVLLLTFSLSFSQNQEKENIKRNIIKTNLTSIVLNNYSLQYERSITKRSSFALQVRLMPETEIIGYVEDYIDDEETNNSFNLATISNFAITPEYRFYVGSGYGKGFYLAPFYRYSKFNLDNINVTFENESGIDESIPLDGQLTGNSFGLMIGAQWHLGANIMLDWWILGPHIGFGKGEITGNFGRNLSQADQDAINKELKDLDLAIYDQEVTVDANSVKVDLDGLFGGIRAGIALGYRF